MHWAYTGTATRVRAEIRAGENQGQSRPYALFYFIILPSAVRTPIQAINRSGRLVVSD